jgi:hypothetical protein
MSLLKFAAPFGVAVAVVAGTWFLIPRGHAPVASSGAPRATTPLPDALDTRTRGWQARQSYRYQLKLGSLMRIGGAEPPAFDFDVIGRVQVEPSAVTTQAVTLHAVMRDARIVSRIPEAQSELDKLAVELNSSGFFFELRAGLLRDMRVPKGASPLVVNTFRTIASALQVARSASDRPDYIATEYDSTGKYRAAYRVDAGGVVQKQKLAYVELLGAQATGTASSLRIVPRIQRADGQLTLTPEGRPLHVSWHEELLLDGAQTPVASTTNLSLSGEGSEASTATGLDAAYASMFVLAASDAYGKVLPEALDRSRIGGLTFETVVSRLEELALKPPAAKVNGEVEPADPKAAGSAEESQLFIALSAILRQQPTTIPKVLQKIRAKSSASSLLVDALGSASSPAAQDALIGLLNAASTPPAQKNQITKVLGRVAIPTESSVAALKAQLAKDPWSRKALFGLGTFSRRLRDAGESERAAQVGDFLVSKLQAAKTPSALVTILRAVANSGYAAALPEVIPYLTDSREQVRVDAVRALQSMKAPQVDDLIVARLESDAASAVRLSAIQAAQVRQPTDVLVHGITRAATNTPDPHVRYRAVEVMLQWLAQRPDLREALVKQSTSDQEPKIRERIAGALATKTG